jgi:hypothetical protein
LLDPPPDFPRELLPPPLREPDFEPLDLAGVLLREGVFFTLLERELLPLVPLDRFVLLRGLTVPLCRLVVVPRPVRLTVPRLLLVPVLRELVPVEFQTRVLRLRDWTDLLSLEVRDRWPCTLDWPLVAFPVVRLLPELALLPTVVGVLTPDAPPLPERPLTRVVPRQLLVVSLTGTSPAWRPSPAAVWRLRTVASPVLAAPVVRPVSRIRRPLWLRPVLAAWS